MNKQKITRSFPVLKPAKFKNSIRYMASILLALALLVTMVPFGRTGQAQGAATGSLNMSVPGVQLLLDRIGQVREEPGQMEVRNRQYEAAGPLPVVINGAPFAATEIKVVSNLKVQAGSGEHQGTIDVDVDAIPGGHITLEYKGTATVVGSTVLSTGRFKTTRTRGIFAGLQAEGAYTMNIAELGSTVGSPVAVTITTVTGTAGLSAPPATSSPVTLAGGSGPGYATGLLNISISDIQLLLTSLGQIKEQPGQMEVKDRQYEAAGSLPVTINGAPFAATEIKVISNLKIKAGSGEHRGTIDVDIDTFPGGHITLEYRGTATVVGSSIFSTGTFKTIKTTDIFAGLVAEGTYSISIAESGNTLGSPATVTISTVSVVPATLAAQQVDPPASQVPPGGPFAGVSGPGYPTGPLSMSISDVQLLLDRVGQVKQEPGQLEVKDRQYEAAGSLPVVINRAPLAAAEIKVVSNLKVKGGNGEHQGTIDVDVDTIPGGHITLEYRGTVTVVGSSILSSGNFKTTKTTGIFAGLVAEGTYSMTIAESGSTLGSPATVTISTVSTAPASPAVQQVTAPFAPSTAGSTKSDTKTASSGISSGSADEVRFTEKVTESVWIIGNVVVVTNSATRLVDNPVPGNLVEVRGVRIGNGVILATEIRNLTKPSAIEPAGGTQGSSSGSGSGSTSGGSGSTSGGSGSTSGGSGSTSGGSGSTSGGRDDKK